MTETTAEQNNTLQELVLYHAASMDFVWDNIYAMGGIRPNAKYIAGEYGCKLEIREGKFSSRVDWTSDYLEARGIDPKTHECMSAVLVGEDRAKLARARDDIYETLGVA